MPFLFVWTAMLFIPLGMSTGVIGFVQYLGYLWPDMGPGQGDLVGLRVIAVIALLWRRVEKHRQAHRRPVDGDDRLRRSWSSSPRSPTSARSVAFTYPAHAFELTASHFWIGFAGGLTIGIYDYLGYNTIAYMGAEIRQPGRTIRAVITSILGIMTIYLLLQIGTLGVVDWWKQNAGLNGRGSGAGTCTSSARISSIRWCV